MAIAAVWRSVDVAPSGIVGGHSAKGDAVFGGVRGAVHFNSGGIVVTDADHAALVFFDARGGLHARINVVGAGGQRAYPFALVRYGQDEVAHWDAAGNQLTILSSKGRVVQVRHIDNPPSRRDRGGRWRPVLQLVGVFGTGGVLASVHGQYSTPDGEVASDSVIVYYADVKGKLDTLGTYLRGERFGFAKRYEVGGQLPLGRAGSFAVDDSVWYYTDGAGYAIQKRSPSGRVIAEFRIERERAAVTPGVIAHLTRARLERSDPVLRMDDSLALRWMPFPRLQPAYTALRVDSDHHVWARSWTFDDEPARWDVFDSSGKFLGMVSVPIDLDVLQIDRDHLLARYTHDPQVDEIRLYRLRRGPE